MPCKIGVLGLLMLCQVTYGQNKSIDKNAILCGILGHTGGLINVNYERIFSTSKDYLLYSIGTGIGYDPADSIGSKRIKGTASVPISTFLMAGKNGHYAQLGLSYTAAFGEDAVDSTRIPPVTYQKYQSNYCISLGYRYMKKGFIVQLYPMFVWSNNPSQKFGAGFGVLLGGTF